MRRIKHGLNRLPKIGMGHARMPDAVLGIGIAGAVLVGTVLPVSQAIAAPAPTAPVTAAAEQPAQGEQQPAQNAEQPAQQAAPDQAQQAQQAQQAAEQAQQAQQAAQPAAARSEVRAEAPAPQQPTYANNLDGWIKQARDILGASGKPVPSYRAMYAAAMAESGGNPKAVNGWDSNAKAGTPSIGLTQMIQPTFRAYALPGHTDIRNPVDNLIASSRYCDATYGGMDKMAAARGYGSHWHGY